MTTRGGYVPTPAARAWIEAAAAPIDPVLALIVGVGAGVGDGVGVVRTTGAHVAGGETESLVGAGVGVGDDVEAATPPVGTAPGGVEDRGDQPAADAVRKTATVTRTTA